MTPHRGQAFKPILEMEDIDWHGQIDVNQSGTMNTVAEQPIWHSRRGSQDFRA